MSGLSKSGFAARSITARLFAVFFAAVIAASAVGAPACKKDEKRSLTFFAMDTVMDISLYGSADALDTAQKTVLDIEKALSVTDAGSEIFKLNEAGALSVSESTANIIKTALALAERTGGAFDPTVYPLVHAWGFTTGEHRVPTDDEIAALIKKVDYRAVETDGGRIALPEGFMLDLGGIAKGYASDRLVELFKAEGVESAVINLGGNVHALGKKPSGEAWNIAINDPAGGYAAILAVSDRAVITSGGYERNFTLDGITYCHIIDPETGRPADSGLASVTVVSSSGTLADALSTALYVMGLENAVEFYRNSSDFDAVFILESGGMYVTEGLKDILSPKGRFGSEAIHFIKKQP